MFSNPTSINTFSTTTYVFQLGLYNMSYVASSSAIQLMSPSPLFYTNATSPVEEVSLGWDGKWMRGQVGEAPPLFTNDNNNLQQQEEDEGEEVRRFLEFMSNRPDNNTQKESDIQKTPSKQQSTTTNEEHLIDGLDERFEKSLAIEEKDKQEDELFRRRMMARLSKSNGLEKMNPKKRRKQQLKYMKFIDTLIAEYNAQVEEDRKTAEQNHLDDNEYHSNDEEE